MTPKVSVVIKSYNHAAFVAQTIQSILDQSFQDFEIVVTDDASTDGTADVVRAFTDPRIDLHVHEQNRGISAAMNATIARARGEFVAILNSDDFALPGRLERQVAFLDGHPDIAAVFAMPRVVDEDGAPTTGFFDFRSALLLPDFSRKSWLRHFFFAGNLLCAPTAMIRRSAYADVGSYDPRLTNLQDLDMWVRLSVSHGMHVMDEELTAFRIRSDQRNMSAPRNDSLLRAQYEYARILRRYRAMDPALLRDVFAEDLSEKAIDIGRPCDSWLAALALTQPSPAHRLFALDTLFETAQSDDDFRRLREITGKTDVFGMLTAAEPDIRLAELSTAVSRYETQLHNASRRIALLQASHPSLARRLHMRDAEVRQLQREIVGLAETQQHLLRSRSWRYTAPLRRLLGWVMARRSK